ncbi:zinc finger protein 423-like isoform X2 [Portunus trituberculatus]|uniref:zinc finger protein 423-like isoform X2 n=1 Tax=Portunus trituberculatus TaxID=210409 RepID=UPI001E1CE2A6|nr:zinc finger protein 423-like isoform X2 [Portunus trituberculatus]
MTIRAVPCLLRVSMAMAEVSAESHKCVFCNQLFPSKAELQTHFRRHANGDIDIKGRPRVRHKAEEDLGTTEECRGRGGGGGGGGGSGRGSAAGNAGGDTGAATGTKNNAVCDVCGEVFRTVSLAISHKFRKHPDSLLKYYCPYCGMMFPIKVNRDKHLASHPTATPQQVYPCRPCGVTFYTQRAKKFHMDSAHKGAIRMVNPVRTPAPSMKIVVNNAGEAHSVYYCHLCGCEYQVKYNLQKHLATKHSESERDALPTELVQCNLCSAVFYTKRAYEAHSHHHREGDLFATNEQMRQQVVQRIDQDFDQRRVPTAVERYLSASAVSSNRSATWRRIQAARRAHTGHQNTKEDKKGSNPDENRKIILSERVAEDRFTQEFLCWETEGMNKKRRMMDDSEEDDGDMRSLGTVNPDTILATQTSRVEEQETEEEEEEEEEEDDQRGSTVEGKAGGGKGGRELRITSSEQKRRRRRRTGHSKEDITKKDNTEGITQH